MRKEVFWAILIGFVIGLIITFGVYKANQALQQTTASPTPSPTPLSTPTPSPPPPLLTISEPEDETLTDQATIPLKGQAAPEAVIAVITEEGEQLFQADENGYFETELELVGGANEIKVIAVSKEGQREEKTLTVVYSTAKINEEE